MENFRTEFRDDLLTDSGGVIASRGDKILYNTGLPAKKSKKATVFLYGSRPSSVRSGMIKCCWTTLKS